MVRKPRRRLRSKTFTTKTKKQHSKAWKYFHKKGKSNKTAWSESYKTPKHRTPKMVVYWYGK